MLFENLVHKFSGFLHLFLFFHCKKLALVFIQPNKFISEIFSRMPMSQEISSGSDIPECVKTEFFFGDIYWFQIFSAALPCVCINKQLLETDPFRAINSSQTGNDIRIAGTRAIC